MSSTSPAKLPVPSVVPAVSDTSHPTRTYREPPVLRLMYELGSDTPSDVIAPRLREDHAIRLAGSAAVVEGLPSGHDALHGHVAMERMMVRRVRS